MMDICDSRGQFLLVETRFPGAVSDYYEFNDSHLKKLLEKKDFPCPGVCLFGDNVCVNSVHMYTPRMTLTSFKLGFVVKIKMPSIAPAHQLIPTLDFALNL